MQRSAKDILNEFMRDGGLADVSGVSAAKAALSGLLPVDFEYYMIALELTDSMDRTIDYLVFPVMPNSYSRSESTVTTVRKTMGGVTAIGNPTFVPIDINISGNFGRRFRIMAGALDGSPASVAMLSTSSGVYSSSGMKAKSLRKVVAGSRIKSGYGAIKVLQAICDKSRGEMEGEPLRLYLYNPAFDDNFLVKVVTHKYSQSMGTNTIWTYDLSLKAIAPMEVVRNNHRSSLVRYMATDIIGDTANSVVGSIMRRMSW